MLSGWGYRPPTLRLTPTLWLWLQTWTSFYSLGSSSCHESYSISAVDPTLFISFLAGVLFPYTSTPLTCPLTRLGRRCCTNICPSWLPPTEVFPQCYALPNCSKYLLFTTCCWYHPHEHTPAHASICSLDPCLDYILDPKLIPSCYWQKPSFSTWQRQKGKI